MAVIQASRFTVKEYLALEAAADARHEYFAGTIVAMAGAEPEHNLIVENLRAELRASLASRRCPLFGSDQRVFIEAVSEYFYPDVSVTCLEPAYVEPSPRSLANPQVIIEVLSPSTERYDRGDKWSAYRSLASLSDYVMVASTKRELDHYHRLPDGSWTLRVLTYEGTITLGNGAVLDLAKLYRLVPGLE
ncbi:MAG TPA: Uma2 family endonuclease [Kofleriaceae bacterium]|nr:Uma2 family endonuclease [Kofleriaceae bacterium]